MKQVEIFDRNVQEYELWYEEHPFVYQSELIAIEEQLKKLPEDIRGIEVGLNTGKFALPLGIKEGIEPASEMAEIASKRGIEVMQGMAENMPYSDLSFDFVLFVTVCHLNDLKEALKESNRVLKRDGSVIIGFIDNDREIAGSYKEKRKWSTFYKHTRFWSVGEIHNLLKETGFKDPEFSQTLFGDIDDITEVEFPKEGYGEGSFVVVKATKK